MFNQPQKQPELMTSEELERAIKEHQAYVRKLIEETRLRRQKESEEAKKQTGRSNE